MIPKLVMQDKWLTVEAKAIYAYFCSYAGAGRTAFPSRERIIADLGMSKSRFYSTGQSDLENFYNLCEQLQRIMLYGNLKYLSEIIFIAAHAKGDIDEKPTVKIKFNPLWSLTDTEQTRATTSQMKAQMPQIYVDMGALDPSEIRKGLAEDKEFDIEKLLDDVPEGDLMSGWEDEPTDLTKTNI